MLCSTYCSWTHRSHLYSLAAHCSVESGRNILHWHTFSGCTVDSLQKAAVLSTFVFWWIVHMFLLPQFQSGVTVKIPLSFSGNVPFIRTVHLWHTQRIWEAGEVPRKCVLNLRYCWEAGIFWPPSVTLSDKEHWKEWKIKRSLSQSVPLLPPQTMGQMREKQILQ